MASASGCDVATEERPPGAMLCLWNCRIVVLKQAVSLYHFERVFGVAFAYCLLVCFCLYFSGFLYLLFLSFKCCLLMMQAAMGPWQDKKKGRIKIF